MKINDLVFDAHKNAVEKGFYNSQRNVPELLMLIVSELGEACEALRKNKITNTKPLLSNPLNDFEHPQWLFNFEGFVKDTFEDEIADCFIRLADLCGYMGIDIESHIKAKMEYNKTRPKKHGKSF